MVRAFLGELGSDLADVVLSRSCVACGTLGRPVCQSCLSRCLSPHPHARASRLIGAPVQVAARYRGIAQQLVIAHKAHGVLALTQPLGAMLALALAHTDHDLGPRLDLVAIPPHRSSLRTRGFDSLELIVHHAVDVLADHDIIAVHHRVLTRVRDAGHQVGRTRTGRAQAIAGSMAVVPGARLPRAAIVVDDVVTSGATLAEASRALQAAGVLVLGGAAVAGTPLRSGQLGEPGA